MKKVMFLLLLLVGMSFAATTATPSLTLTVSNISETVRPGSSFLLQMLVVNNGGGTAKNLTVEPVIAKPFRIKTGTSDVANIGDISLGQSGSAKLYLYVLPDTPGDVYDLDVVTSYNSGNKRFSLTRTVSILIEASPTLEIIDAEYGIIYPGDSATLTLEIRNIGNGKARNIRALYANSSGAILPSGSAVAYVESLEPGKTKMVDIPISIMGDAEAGSYSVNVVVSYEDEDGTPQTELARSIGLGVQSNIELKTYFDNGRVIQNIPSEVVISIANTGPSTAQYLEVMPTSKSGFKVTPEVIYIGNLESDDFDTAEFEITSANAGDQQLELQLVYKDKFNNEQMVTRKIGITALTPKEAAAFEQRSLAPYFLLLILIGVGIWYWRRRKKQKA